MDGDMEPIETIQWLIARGETAVTITADGSLCTIYRETAVNRAFYHVEGHGFDLWGDAVAAMPRHGSVPTDEFAISVSYHGVPVGQVLVFGAERVIDSRSESRWRCPRADRRPRAGPGRRGLRRMRSRRLVRRHRP